jgi:putative transferase (TIGR04331 family)
MARSFHVSAMPFFWEKGLKKKYIAEPYVAHHFNLATSDDIIIADYTRKNKAEYIDDCHYLNKKIEQYRSLIINNLNILHGTEYSNKFWTKALGTGFNRFVHMLYDGYKIASQFDPANHVVTVLDKRSYCHFQDFEEFRELIQYNDFGFEQVFSLFIATFYPEIYEENQIRISFKKPEQKIVSVKKHNYWQRIKRMTFRQLYHRLLKKVFFLNEPIIAVFHSYFSKDNMDKLYRKSHVRIDPINFNYSSRVDKQLDPDFREKLRNNFPSNDSFDQFFEKALELFFPTLYVESFVQTMFFHQKEALKYKELKYLIAEGWIGNSRMSLFIAVLQLRGIFHVYNEHNYLQQFLVGNQLNQLVKMCDQFYSLGWRDNNYAQIKAGASLFPFSIESKTNTIKEIDYLYISAFPEVKMADVNCANGESQENAPRYFDYVTKFFSSLSKSVITKIVFRCYPNNFNGFQYNFRRVIEPFYSKMKAIDNGQVSSKKQMLKSRLVIIDYLSTAYLEALIMNIPTLILFDPSRYFMEKSYENFFDELIHVGVIQTNPEVAAEFINNMGENIEQWWESKEVQKARKCFLDKNIGKPEDAISYYLNLLKE